MGQRTLPSFKVPRRIIYARWSRALTASFRFEGQPRSLKKLLYSYAFMPRNNVTSRWNDDIGPANVCVWGSATLPLRSLGRKQPWIAG